VCFASLLSGEFITATVVNPPERKLAKRTSVQWGRKGGLFSLSLDFVDQGRIIHFLVHLGRIMLFLGE
jgi:hypothetical protein